MLICMGGKEETRQMLAAKFQAIFPHLDERQRRLMMMMMMGRRGACPGARRDPAGGPGRGGPRGHGVGGR
jgi:hypothetical protein